MIAPAINVMSKEFLHRIGQQIKRQEKTIRLQVSCRFKKLAVRKKLKRQGLYE